MKKYLNALLSFTAIASNFIISNIMADKSYMNAMPFIGSSSNGMHSSSFLLNLCGNNLYIASIVLALITIIIVYGINIFIDKKVEGEENNNKKENTIIMTGLLFIVLIAVNIIVLKNMNAVY